MKNLLILGASKRHAELLKNSTISSFITAIDRDINAPGFNYCDAYAVRSIKDTAENFSYEHYGDTDGCVCIPDIGVKLQAELNAKFKLKGIKPDTYDLVTNKHKFYNTMEQNNRNVPKRYSWYNATYPAIIKPVSSTGSQNIHLVGSAMDTVANINGQDYLIQEYIEGQNVSVDLIMQDGIVKRKVIQDRYTIYDDCFVDNIIISPSKYCISDKLYLDSTLSLIAYDVAKAIRFTDGPLNVQFIIDKHNVPYVIEVNPRISGPFGIECHTMATTYNWFEDIVNVALGNEIGQSISPVSNNVCITIGSDIDGIIEDIVFPEEIKDAKVIWFWKAKGDKVKAMKAVKDSVCHIYMEGGSYNSLFVKARSIVDNTKIITR